MASHRKEPLKRRDSESTYFVSPSIMALLLALLFVVAFKVDDDGKLLRSSPYFCSVCRVSPRHRPNHRLVYHGRHWGVGWVLHCPQKADVAVLLGWRLEGRPCRLPHRLLCEPGKFFSFVDEVIWLRWWALQSASGGSCIFAIILHNIMQQLLLSQSSLTSYVLLSKSFSDKP